MLTKLFLSGLFLALGGAFFYKMEKPAPAAAPVPMGVSPKSDPENPTELGAVHWSRDLDAAVEQSEQSGKPLLILFQEVPGCSNCTRYGSVTLRHPLIVEAIESYFIPVCIYNNKGGKDADALRRFQESPWNNPVVRIVDASGKDLAPRMPDFRSSAEIVQGMLTSMERSKLPQPLYLQLLAEELAARENGTETATFSMYCFWAGEGAFGAIPGVVETAPGYQDGHEVVRVTYNPAVVSKQQLEKITQPKGVSACSGNSGFRGDSEPKYYLSKTYWKYVPMTSLQACRANSLCANNESVEIVLSPQQIALGNAIKSNPKKHYDNAIGATDLAAAWQKL